MEWKHVLIGLAGLLGIYLIGTAILRPLRFLIGLAVWALLGCLVMVVINAVFGPWGFHIAINPVTILTAGILQLPGIALLVALNCFMV